ncbi:MAG: DUF3710 domain-containing protein [Aeromicrobium erythreum]
MGLFNRRDDRKVDDPADDVADETTGTSTESESAPASSAPASGPWDHADRPAGVDDDPAYLDLGSLLVKGRPGFGLQLPQDDDSGTIGSVVLVTEESALELRAFAASRSGGLWDEVRQDLLEEVSRLEGEAQEVEGPFGTELRARVPVELENGEAGFQPSRMVGIEGPRWFLRATFLGQEALEPQDDSVLMGALRDVVVRRGDEPRAVREPLLISVGDGIELVAVDEDDAAAGPADPARD